MGGFIRGPVETGSVPHQDGRQRGCVQTCKVAASQNTWCIQTDAILEWCTGSCLVTSDHHKIRLNSIAEERRVNACSTRSFDFKYRVCRTMRQLGNKRLKKLVQEAYKQSAGYYKYNYSNKVIRSPQICPRIKREKKSWPQEPTSLDRDVREGYCSKMASYWKRESLLE